jgi:hypothetical protein
MRISGAHFRILAMLTTWGPPGGVLVAVTVKLCSKLRTRERIQHSLTKTSITKTSTWGS